MDLEIELVAMEDNCEHTKSLFDSENNKKCAFLAIFIIFYPIIFGKINEKFSLGKIILNFNTR